jgi:hypothetical protein
MPPSPCPPPPLPTPTLTPAEMRARLVAIRRVQAEQMSEIDAMLTAIGNEPAIQGRADFEWAKDYAHNEGVSEGTVYRWIRLGLPHRCVGKQFRVDVARAAAWHQAGGARRALEGDARKKARRAG